MHPTIFLLALTVLSASGSLAVAEDWGTDEVEWMYRRHDAPKYEPKEDKPRRAKKGRLAPLSPDELIVEQALTRETIAREERFSPQPKLEAERASEPLRERPRQAARERRLAALETARTFDTVREEPSSPARAEKTVQVRLGILGGLSSVSAANANTQNFRQEQALTQNIVFGVTGDVRMMEYFGAEIEGYLGLAPKITLSGADGAETTKSVKHSGAFFNLKGQFALSQYLKPKFGLGYGVIGLGQGTTANGQETSASQKIAGTFATLGVDVTPTENLLFTLDYARSLGASGTLATSSTGQADQLTELSSAAFDRVRLSAFYKCAPQIWGGLQFNLRKMASDSSTAEGSGNTSPTSSESFSQFLAVGVIEF